MTHTHAQYLSLELGVGDHAAGRAQNHPSPHVLSLHSSHQDSQLVSRLPHLQLLLERLQSCTPYIEFIQGANQFIQGAILYISLETTTVQF